ncbi:MAG TPA: tetratricopeptide repeat protein, partial [Nitrospiria bacterium]|nr:tetratricopeptide repeat protein [Nitrospiria bacterium]
KPDALRIGAPFGTLSDLTFLNAGQTTWGGREAEEVLWLADQKGVRIFIKRISAVAGLTAFQLRFQLPTFAFDASAPILRRLLDDVQWRPRVPTPADEVSAYREVGKSFTDQKRYADAIRVYQKALEVSPRDASLHLLLADAARQGTRLDLSEQAYREAIRFSQNDPRPYQGLADVMMERKNPSEAIRLLQKAIPMAPQDASLRSDLGRSLIAAGKPEEALDNFKKAIRRDRNLADARVGLAQAYRATGELDLAVNAYQDALRIKPSLKEIHCELEQIYRVQEFTAEAEAERKLCPSPLKDTTPSSPSSPDGNTAPPREATP